MALRTGQFQIGDLVFGRNTLFPINELNMNGYDVTSGDYQIASADELRMTRDFFAPTAISFTLAVLDNFILPNMGGFGTAVPVPDGRFALDNLVREWRADEVRKVWGATKPIKSRQDNGKTTLIYGRPRKLAVGKASRKSEFAVVVAEFQRSDTLAYSNEEYFVNVLPGAGSTAVSRFDGQAPSWLRFLITGPANDPLITFGSQFQVQLDYNIPAGKVVEVNSYPWTRRVILAPDNLNLSPLMIPPSPYLSEMKFLANTVRNVSWSAGGTTGASNLSVLWREAYLYW
jgi:hypothetical protein